MLAEISARITFEPPTVRAPSALRPRGRACPLKTKTDCMDRRLDDKYAPLATWSWRMDTSEGGSPRRASRVPFGRAANASFVGAKTVNIEVRLLRRPLRFAT